MALPSRREATIEDLYRVPDGHNAELVGGEIVLMAPTGFLPGRAAHRITTALALYEYQTGAGYSIPDNVGFIVNLPHRRSFSPDAAFYVGPAPPDPGRFINGCPTFAAEVRSENDYGPAAERDIARKRADYFAAGTLIYWDVDVLKAETVTIYQANAPDSVRILHRGAIADAEPALPGWRMAVDDLFTMGPFLPVE